MNGQGQSDRPVVPTKSPNNAGGSAAGGMEGRGLANGNPNQQNGPRAQHRDGALSALERARQAAERDKKERFTAPLHHVYNIEHLQLAEHALQRHHALDALYAGLLTRKVNWGLDADIRGFSRPSTTGGW